MTITWSMHILKYFQIKTSRNCPNVSDYMTNMNATIFTVNWYPKLTSGHPKSMLGISKGIYGYQERKVDKIATIYCCGHKNCHKVVNYHISQVGHKIREYETWLQKMAKNDRWPLKGSVVQSKFCNIMKEVVKCNRKSYKVTQQNTTQSESIIETLQLKL